MESLGEGAHRAESARTVNTVQTTAFFGVKLVYCGNGVDAVPLCNWTDAWHNPKGAR